MATPATPPRTPFGGDDRGDVFQGDVQFGDVKNKGGVVTGNVNGYNVIVGTLNVTVQAATDLTKNIHAFTARVATASQRLRSVADKVSATSAVLLSIQILVRRLAKSEGISIGHDGNQGTREKGGLHALGTDDAGESKVLKKKCFKDLLEASSGATALFQGIDRKIRDASDMIPSTFVNSSMGMERGHANTSRTRSVMHEGTREKMSLTEMDIDIMEKQIESHKLEVKISLTVFQAVLDDDRSEAVKATMLDMFEEIMAIKNYLTAHVSGRIHKGVLDRGHDIHEPDAKDPSAVPFLKPPLGLEKSAPFSLSWLTPLYIGWTFAKARPPGSETALSRLSWRYAVPRQMTFSTEELFLRVLSQITQRAKLNRTMQDDCKQLLRSKSRKALVDDLLRKQNVVLQRSHPQLEWKLAGVARTTQKTRSNLEVILKTEWAPGSRPGAPGSPGVQSTFIAGDKEHGMPSDGVDSRREEVWLTGQRWKHPNDRHRHRSKFDLYPRSSEFRPWAHDAPTRPVPISGIALHQPQLVFVREGKKHKLKPSSTAENGRRVYIGNDIRGSHLYVELRPPGVYAQGNRYDPVFPSASFHSPSLQPMYEQRPPRPVSMAPTASIRPHPPAPRFPPLRSRYTAPMQTGHSRLAEERASRASVEMTIEEGEQLVEDMFDEWEEAVDNTQGRRRRSERQSRRRTTARRSYSRVGVPTGSSDVGATRLLMREVERECNVREMDETRFRREKKEVEREIGMRERAMPMMGGRERGARESVRIVDPVHRMRGKPAMGRRVYQSHGV